MQKKNKIENIFMTGFFGAGNVGDEAVAVAVRNGLKNVYPEAAFSIVTRNPQFSEEFSNITDATFIKGFFPSVDYFKNCLKHLKAIYNSDLIVIGGGGILQDVHSWTTIPAHLLPACFGIILNKRIVTVGLGVGPVQRNWLKRFIKFVGNNIIVSQVRDQYSKLELLDYGVKVEKIKVTADVVPSLLLKKIIGDTEILKDSLDRKIVGIAFRKWESLDEIGLIHLCSQLLENDIKLKFLCYEPAADQLFYKNIIKQLKGTSDNIELQIPNNLKDALIAVQTTDFMLSMRLHGCVFSAALNKEFLSFPYDSKVSEFVASLEMKDRIISINDIPANLSESIIASLKNTQILKNYSAKFNLQRDLSTSNFSNLDVDSGNISLKSKLISCIWILNLFGKGLSLQIVRPFNFLYRKVKKTIQ